MQAQGDPGRVTVLYERAVAVFPVTHYLWLQYARYLETHIKLPIAIHSVYERAVRNCPWVAALWARYGLLLPVRSMQPFLLYHKETSADCSKNKEDIMSDGAQGKLMGGNL